MWGGGRLVPFKVSDKQQCMSTSSSARAGGTQGPGAAGWGGGKLLLTGMEVSAYLSHPCSAGARC